MGVRCSGSELNMACNNMSRIILLVVHDFWVPFSSHTHVCNGVQLLCRVGIFVLLL